MSSQLTPREHDDIRDLLIAGTQRIRPARSNRVRISTAVAVVLVAGAVGGVAAAALSTGRDGAAVYGSPNPTATSTPTPTVDPDPWPTVISAPPPSVLPDTGTHTLLQPIPSMDQWQVVGTSDWLDEQGIDVGTIQGYESLAADWIEPWTADLKDGTGQCLLIRKDPGGSGGWSEIVCDANGVPAWVDREVDGAVLRFTIVGDAVDVYRVPR